MNGEVNGPRLSVSVGPDFFEKRTPAAVNTAEDQTLPDSEPVIEPSADVEMAETKSQDSYDPLFDEDADGEVVPSAEISAEPTPSATTKPTLSLALPVVPSSSSNSLFAPPLSANSSRQGLASTIPTLSPTNYKAFSNDVLMTSSMDGQVTLIDRRMGSDPVAGRLIAGERAPPWCMSVCH